MAVVWRLPQVPLLDRRMPQPHPPAMSPRSESGQLKQVARAARERMLAEVRYGELVLSARQAGHTYEEIAKAAGTTRSAIHNYLSRRGQT